MNYGSAGALPFFPHFFIRICFREANLDVFIATTNPASAAFVHLGAQSVHVDV